MHRFELNALAITKSVHARSTVFVTVYIVAIFARNCARDDNRRSFRWAHYRTQRFSAREIIRVPSFGSTNPRSLCLSNYAPLTMRNERLPGIGRLRGDFNSPTPWNQVLSRIYWAFAKIEQDLNSLSLPLPIRLAPPLLSHFTGLIGSFFRPSQILLYGFLRHWARDGLTFEFGRTYFVVDP